MSMRKKLTAFFLVIILLMSAVTVYIYSSSQRAINQYDEVLQRFLLLNEISQVHNELNTLFNNYLLVPSPGNLENYEEQREALLYYREQFNEMIAPENEVYMSKNFYHMLAYLTDRMDNAIEAYGGSDSPAYLNYRDEAERVTSWLNDTTLNFLNDELEDYHEFYSDLIIQNQYQLSLALSVAVSLLIASLVFAYVFLKKITDPVQVLVKQAKALSAGNFNIGDAPESKDEMGVLAGTFNRMKASIHQLIEEMKERARLEAELKEQTIKNMETNRLLKEMELRSLQNQMNPHFLFNTLNTVSKLAYIEGADKSSDLIVSISQLLRYNLRSIDKPVTLEEEINHVKDYIIIQQSRFGNRVTFSMNFDVSKLNHNIPLLTLQPLVENAYIHGIEPMERGGEITINAEETADYIVVKVSDNGAGIPEEKLKEIKYYAETGISPEQTGHTTGIGLTNVYKRLSLFYNTNDVLLIESQPGEGTTVTLKLPIEITGKGKEEHNVQAVNSRR